MDNLNNFGDFGYCSMCTCIFLLYLVWAQALMTSGFLMGSTLQPKVDRTESENEVTT